MSRRNFAFVLAAAAGLPVTMWAQFTSGSTGSDGALNLTTPGTIYFDPATFNPPLNPPGDNVFNFTTINIASGVTVIMQSHLLRNRSVIWLATGDVTIAGTLILDGAGGAYMNPANPGLNRSPSEPGPGGYPGGVGTYLGKSAQPGEGYGGGAAGGGNGVYSYFNNQLTPLLGGSGGGGGIGGTFGGIGGAGGGAIRIVSTSSINVTGTISAVGGGGSYGSTYYQYFGGHGSGGVIHLIAPAVSGTANLSVGGCGGGSNPGIVEISANTNTTNIAAPCPPPLITAGLYNPPPVIMGRPAVLVVKVDGVVAPVYPTASYSVPDVTINTSKAVVVNIAAQNVPLGTVVNLALTSENGPDTSVSCAPLAGALANSTAKCSGANFPSGVTITEITATW